MLNKRVMALVLAALVAGAVLGSFGVASATSNATLKPGVPACEQADCASVACPSGAGQCDMSDCGAGDCAVKPAEALCDGDGCAMRGDTSTGTECGSGVCGGGQ